MARDFGSFWEFFPFYMTQHLNKTNQYLHLIGTSLSLVLMLVALFSLRPWLAGVGIVQGYAWAWVGHFFFERNKPATFKNPFYSAMGDFVMCFYIWTGQIDQVTQKALDSVQS